MRSSSLIKSYQRARFLRRVMLAFFVAMTVGTLLWAVPWVPWGLRTDDYNASAAIPVALGFGAWLSAFGAVYLRDQSNRYEQTLVTWASVHDELGDLRPREYFFERVVMECTRSDRSEVPFGVFAMRFGAGEEMHAADTATVLETIGGLMRQSDSLAALGAQEVGVLGVGMGQREAPAFAYRLKSSLENVLPGHEDQVNVGWAIWGVDAKDAGSLVGIARTRMQRKTATRALGRTVQPDELSAPDAANVIEPMGTIVDIASRRDDSAA